LLYDRGLSAATTSAAGIFLSEKRVETPR
jgi:hypothetical protein